MQHSQITVNIFLALLYHSMKVLINDSAMAITRSLWEKTKKYLSREILRKKYFQLHFYNIF